MSGIVCYCLRTHDGSRTYVGATKNLTRRVRQHNGELVGGAKYTSRIKNGWCVFLVVHNFKTWRDALSFEWRWKHVKRYRRKESPCAHRIRNLKLTLARKQWCTYELDIEYIGPPEPLLFPNTNHGVLMCQREPDEEREME